VGELLPAGTRVAGRYRVIEKLGEGGVGVVWLADDDVSGRRVALKLVRDEVASRADVGRRFLREARAAQLLDHDGSVRVYDCGVWRSRQYIAMEHVEGRTLADLVDAEGGFDAERAADLIVQLCEVLGAAHARGLLHRDLKPENVLVTRDPSGAERVKVVDFGLALLLNADWDSRITQEHVVIGTPSCMAPEQISNQPLDARVDLYAVGCLLYELLAGEAPFTEKDTIDLLHHHLHTTPPTPSVRSGRAIPPALEAIAMWCLLKDRAARPTTAEELATAIREAVANPGAVRRVRRRSPVTPLQVAAVQHPIQAEPLAPRLRLHLFTGPDVDRERSALRTLCAAGWLVSVRPGAPTVDSDGAGFDCHLVDVRAFGAWDALALSVDSSLGVALGPPTVVVGPDGPPDVIARAFAAGADAYVCERDLDELPARVLGALAQRPSPPSSVASAQTP
jgi:serine/threonine-protein kinase